MGKGGQKRKGVKGKGKGPFYIDAPGHRDQPVMALRMRHMAALGSNVTFLGMNVKQIEVWG